jgi:hypothetical protein
MAFAGLAGLADVLSAVAVPVPVEQESRDGVLWSKLGLRFMLFFHLLFQGIQTAAAAVPTFFGPVSIPLPAQQGAASLTANLIIFSRIFSKVSQQIQI